jgi:hypothetical protein
MCRKKNLLNLLACPSGFYLSIYLFRIINASGGQKPRGAGNLLLMTPMVGNTGKQIPLAPLHIGPPCQGVEKRFLDFQKLFINSSKVCPANPQPVTRKEIAFLFDA